MICAFVIVIIAVGKPPEQRGCYETPEACATMLLDARRAVRFIDSKQPLKDVNGNDVERLYRKVRCAPAS